MGDRISSRALCVSTRWASVADLLVFLFILGYEVLELLIHPLPSFIRRAVVDFPDLAQMLGNNSVVIFGCSCSEGG